MIKKLIMGVLVVLLCAGVAFAEGTVTQKPSSGTYYERMSEDMQIATFTIADDSGSVPKTNFLDPTKVKGWYIMTVEAKSSSDDSLTVLIETALGADLFNKAYTSATSGEIKNADDRWPISSTPKIDVTNMSSDTVTVIVTFVK
jgi:hypothetical protein